MVRQATDAELIEDALNGDAGAYREIVERHKESVTVAALNACGNEALSQEICEETFIAAWRNIQNVADPNRLRSWLCGIASNRAKSAIRLSRLHVFSEDAPTGEFDRLTDGPSQLSSSVGQGELEDLWCAIHRLPIEYRDPLILFYERGATIREISRTLEISVVTVKERMRRGKLLLHEASARISECLSSAETSLVLANQEVRAQ